MQEKQNPDGQTTIGLMVKRPSFWHSLMVKRPSAWWSNDHRFGQFWGFPDGHLTPSLIYHTLKKVVVEKLAFFPVDKSGRSMRDRFCARATFDQSGANARKKDGPWGPRGGISFPTLLRGCAR